jgi:hypothetical protein
MGAMNGFNRIVVVVLAALLLVGLLVFAAVPLTTVDWLRGQLDVLAAWLAGRQETNPTSFIVGQAALGIGALLVLGALLFFEIMSGRRRGVRIRTLEGRSAELDTDSVARRLQWHLDQLADVITVIPNVKASGRAVNIRLEIETAPDIDIPMKTDEVVELTRGIIEDDMGLKLGKLDVRVRCAPFDPEWVG